MNDTLNSTKKKYGSHSYDDEERYLKMAMKIDPEDSFFLERNEKIKLFANYSN